LLILQKFKKKIDKELNFVKGIQNSFKERVARAYAAPKQQSFLHTVEAVASHLQITTPKPGIN